MKNLMIKILVLAICMISLNLQAQVSPADKEMADKLEQQKREYKRKQMAANSKAIYFEEEKEKSFTYIELELIKTEEGEYKVLEQKKELKINSEDKNQYNKVNFLMKLPDLLGKGYINVVSELGKQGIKIISHSFAETKKGEKHIYILEL